LKRYKNILFILFLAVAALTVFGVSYKMGKMLFLTYKTTVKGPSQDNVHQNSKEMPGVAVVPKADPQVEKAAVKNGVNELASTKAVESAVDKVEKVSNTDMKKNMFQVPAEIIAAPATGIESPAAAKPEGTTPALIGSKSQPAMKQPRSVPKQKTTAKATKKVKEYIVVAASFPTEASVEPVVNRLKAENYKPIVVQAHLAQGRFYRVIVGSYGSLSEAHAEMAELKKLGLQPFCIVKQN
jgi:cell division septation protein DedD